MDGRKWQDYLDWFAQTLRLKVPMLIFAEQETCDFVLKHRSLENTKLIVQKLEQVPYYHLKEDIDKIIASENYQNSIIHPQRIECRYSLYNIIQYSKFKWLQKTAEENPFCSNFFFWLDAGASRFFETMDLTAEYTTPAMLRFLEESKGKFILQYNANNIDLVDFIDSLNGSTAMVCGSLFGGNRSIIEQVQKEIENILINKMIKYNTINNEQIAFFLLVQENPGLFAVLNRTKKTGGTPLPIFSWLQEGGTHRALKIALIAPGQMPIPPKGWGAVEIIAWNLKLELEKQGHFVELINTKNRQKIHTQLSNFMPDFVHILYDEFIDIYPHICFPKAITSHYGYLGQPLKWSRGYQKVFDYFRIYRPNTFCLSKEIADVYKIPEDIPENRLYSIPNGVELNKFSNTLSPKYPDRSIYLAKIDFRKRQYLFQEIKTLYFAGNISDKRFDTSKNYLGEMTKEDIYSGLTNYGNLVLLSDGEAHPLVCMEALAAGLGVVVCEWGSANLDTTKEFITVIPEEKISDIAHVETEIIKNREYAVAHRLEILAYAKQFDWETIVKNYYLPAVRDVIAKPMSNEELIYSQKSITPEEYFVMRNFVEVEKIPKLFISLLKQKQQGPWQLFTRLSFKRKLWTIARVLSKKLKIYKLLQPLAKQIKKVL